LEMLPEPRGYENPLCFSIVVVAWNNAGDIVQALNSCVFPNFSNYEVIVVYNKSEDRTLAEVKAVSERYPSLFRIIENKENEGSGNARNQGIHAAQGEYIVFLDGDDWFSPDALQTIDAHVSKHSPLVLYYNFSRAYPDGKIRPNHHPTLLKQGWRRTGRERASLLANFGVSWNRAYRRDFLLKNSLHFPTGFYQDLSWNLEVLCYAEAIYVIPDIIIFYRQGPRTVLGTVGSQHFDMLKACRRALFYLHENPHFVDDFGKPAYHKCLDDLMGNLKLRIPPEYQQEYLNAANLILSDFRKLIGRTNVSLHERILTSNIGVSKVLWLLACRKRILKLLRWKRTPMQHSLGK
jgi:glycosyltransferase involved in cell wall biosynthesis